VFIFKSAEFEYSIVEMLKYIVNAIALKVLQTLSSFFYIFIGTL